LKARKRVENEIMLQQAAETLNRQKNEQAEVEYAVR
jgi:hypothetical protein